MRDESEIRLQIEIIEQLETRSAENTGKPGELNDEESLGLTSAKQALQWALGNDGEGLPIIANLRPGLHRTIVRAPILKQLLRKQK